MSASVALCTRLWVIGVSRSRLRCQRPGHAITDRYHCSRLAVRELPAKEQPGHGCFVTDGDSSTCPPHAISADLDVKLVFGEAFSAGPERGDLRGFSRWQACRPAVARWRQGEAAPSNLRGGRSPARRCRRV